MYPGHILAFESNHIW